MGSVWAIVGIGLVFLMLLLTRVAFLLVLRHEPDKSPRRPGPPPRVIKANPQTSPEPPASPTHETTHDDHR